MKSIEFSDGEINALVQLIDIAVKAGGLNVAQAGAALAEKLTGQPQVQTSPFFTSPQELESGAEDAT
jgi:predicted house-cleaning NTP pyrophosphatase (Maf/HAM1 superfamily)